MFFNVDLFPAFVLNEFKTMAQLLSNEEEVLEAFDPSIAASRRFKYVLVFQKAILDDSDTII